MVATRIDAERPSGFKATLKHHLRGVPGLRPLWRTVRPLWRGLHALPRYARRVANAGPQIHDAIRWRVGLDRFIGLGDQQLLTDSECRKAGEIIDWIQSVIAGRSEYLRRHRLDPEIHFPQAIWGSLDEPIYDGFRALCSKDRHVLNYFRMWTQHFTGYRLFSLELADGTSFPTPDEVSPAADSRYKAIANKPDHYVSRYRDVCRLLPRELHISPAPRFGEIGWRTRGKIVTCDTYAYQERIALMFECGAIDHLKAVAATGKTPRILEIGGGFGGLAYYLKEIIPEAQVVIVDIPESLVFAAIYLSLSRPDERHVCMADAMPAAEATLDGPGCMFVPNFIFDKIVDAGRPFDLAINTLSMSEMGAHQVAYYCRGIQKLLAPGGGFFEQNQDNSTIGKLDARGVIVEHFSHRLELSSKIVPNPVHGNAHLWSDRPWMESCDGFAGFGQQQLTSDAEWSKAAQIIDWIDSALEDRPAYLSRNRLDPEIHFPKAIWGTLASPLYDGFRLVRGKNRHVVNYLRMWTQHFTGHRLLSMERAGGKPFPTLAEVSPAADAGLEAIAGHPDTFVACYKSICRKLPRDLHISPPRRFGEIGWIVNGSIVNRDTYSYQERIALMYECGAIDHLKAVAAAGRTPRVLEIGGGFGALAYHLKKIVPQARVVIVDIPESLVFSAIYLSLLQAREKHVYMTDGTAAPDAMSSSPGCTFVPNFMFDQIVAAGEPIDLAINTLSMSEMDQNQISYYCRGIQHLLGERGAFFEQNQDNTPIGKLDARRVIVDHFAHRIELQSTIVPHPVHGAAHIWSNRPWGTAANLQRRKLARCA